MLFSQPFALLGSLTTPVKDSSSKWERFSAWDFREPLPFREYEVCCFIWCGQAEATKVVRSYSGACLCRRNVLWCLDLSIQTIPFISLSHSFVFIFPCAGTAFLQQKTFFFLLSLIQVVMLALSHYPTADLAWEGKSSFFAVCSYCPTAPVAASLLLKKTHEASIHLVLLVS